MDDKIPGERFLRGFFIDVIDENHRMASYQLNAFHHALLYLPVPLHSVIFKSRALFGRHKGQRSAGQFLRFSFLARRIIIKVSPQVWKAGILFRMDSTFVFYGDEMMIEYLAVIPHEGIGPLKLGMSSEEIFLMLEQLHTKWTSQQKIGISKATKDDCFTRYQDGSSFFMVQYENNKAIEIAVDDELRAKMIIEIYGMDVFQTAAESLISNLKKRSACNYDREDELLSTNYEFDDIGIRLWREEAFHPKLLTDTSYVREMGDTIAEMYPYLYFQLIAVKSL